MSSITFPTNLLTSIDILRPESSASQEISLIAWEALSHFVNKMQNISEYIGAICFVNGFIGAVAIYDMRKTITLTSDINHEDAKEKWLWYGLLALFLAGVQSVFTSIFSKNYNTLIFFYAEALKGLYPDRIHSTSSCDDLVKFVKDAPAFVEKNRFNFGVIIGFAFLSASASLVSLYSKVSNSDIEKEQKHVAKTLLIASLSITALTTVAYSLAFNYAKLRVRN